MHSKFMSKLMTSAAAVILAVSLLVPVLPAQAEQAGSVPATGAAAAPAGSAVVSAAGVSAETVTADPTAVAVLADPNTASFSNVPGAVSMIAVGDNLAHDRLYEPCYDPATGIYNFNPLYDHVRNQISSYDLAAVNQETVLVQDRSDISTYPDFGTPQEMGDALVGAGFDIVTQATNHAMDKGSRGIQNSIDFWRTKYPQITLLGIHDSVEDNDRIQYLDRNGIRFALFNYTYGLNGRALRKGKEYQVNILWQSCGLPDPTGAAGTDGVFSGRDRLIRDLETAEPNADISVCFLHEGEEYHYEPSAEQTTLVQELIDAGADIIISEHPHVIEPFGLVTTANGNTGIVYYSLGNFCARQRRVATELSGAASLQITKDNAEIPGAYAIPVLTGTPAANATVSAEQAAPAPVADAADASMAAAVPAFHKGNITVTATFLPLVTHYEGGVTQVYFLSDYTEELAVRHDLRKAGKPFTTEDLWSIWNQYAYLDPVTGQTVSITR